MSERTVELYLNETVGSMFWGYHPDARFRCAYRGRLTLPAADQAALNELFHLFNQPVRPDSYIDRSLSMADVVTLDGQVSHAVAGVGFCELDRLYTGDDVVSFDEWEAGPGRTRHTLPESRRPPFGGMTT